VATNGSGASEAPPFTPAADGQADAQKGVQSAAPTLPALPAPRASAPPAQRPAPPLPIPAPTAKPQVAKATPKPVPTSAPQKTQQPKSTPEPRAQVAKATAKPVPTPAPQKAAPVAVAQAAAPSSAPEPTPVPKAVEPPPAPVVIAAPEPKPTKVEPGPLVPPTVTKRVEPSYSPKAVKGIGDPRVVLRVLVDAQGRITRVLVDKGIPGSDLEAAAVSAVLRWQFQPGSQDGKPVDSWATAEFKFSE
jgi:periplasmic protein TonB